MTYYLIKYSPIIVILIGVLYFLFRCKKAIKLNLPVNTYWEILTISTGYILLFELILIHFYFGYTYMTHRVSDHGMVAIPLLCSLMIGMAIPYKKVKKSDRFYKYHFYALLSLPSLLCILLVCLIPLAIIPIIIGLGIFYVGYILVEGFIGKNKGRYIFFLPIFFILSLLIVEELVLTKKDKFALDDHYKIKLKLNPGLYGFTDVNYMTTVKVKNDKIKEAVKFKWISVGSSIRFYIEDIEIENETKKFIIVNDGNYEIKFIDYETMNVYEDLYQKYGWYRKKKWLKTPDHYDELRKQLNDLSTQEIISKSYSDL